MKLGLLLALSIGFITILGCVSTTNTINPPDKDVGKRAFNEAVQKVEAGQLDEALKLFRVAIANEEQSADAHNNIGNVLVMKKEVKDAVSSYTAAVRLDPKSAAYVFNRAYAYLLSGNRSASLMDFNRVIEMEPFNSKASAFRGQIRIESDDYLGAIDDFNKALILLPTNGALLANRGVAHAKVGNLKAAQKDFAHAEKAFRNTGDLPSLKKLTKARDGYIKSSS